MDFIVDTFEEVDSTNVVVRAALNEGRTAGYVVRARMQRGGYGRQGRQWVSPAGGLYQSLLLRPIRAREEWPTLALVVALGVRAGLLDFADVQAGGSQSQNEACRLDEALAVKWPNDLMLGTCKLAGISCEALEGAGGAGVCVGIGVNIFLPHAPSEAPAPDDKNTPAYLSEFLALPCGETAAATDAIIAACGDTVLEHVGELLELWELKGFAAFQRQYCETCSLLEKFVRLMLMDGGTLAQGIVRGIDASGRLVIEDEAHNIQAFSSGEVHVYN